MFNKVYLITNLLHIAKVKRKTKKFNYGEKTNEKSSDKMYKNL